MREDPRRDCRRDHAHLIDRRILVERRVGQEGGPDARCSTAVLRFRRQARKQYHHGASGLFGRRFSLSGGWRLVSPTESWHADRARCEMPASPKKVVYRPKTDIALELYDRARAQKVHFEWLTFDEWYGSKPPFLRKLDTRKQKFIGEMHKGCMAWIDPPRKSRLGRSAAARRSSSQDSAHRADSRRHAELSSNWRIRIPHCAKAAARQT